MRDTHTRYRQLVVIVITSCVLSVFGCSDNGWKTASREPAGIAPDPHTHQEAVIEFYAADAYSWRGWFAVHTWLAYKRSGEKNYTVYEVVGWRTKRGLPALHSYQTATPDRYWYGARPEKILSIEGPRAAMLIPKMEAAIQRYPWSTTYTLFPGPNSNTFPAWVGRQVPELGLHMPFSAIGSGYDD